MEFPNFRRDGETLSISGSLTFPLDMKFDIETGELVRDAAGKGLKDVTIDIRNVEAMGSQYLGALAAVAADMKKHGGGLTVRAKGSVADLIRQVGLDRVLVLDIE